MTLAAFLSFAFFAAGTLAGLTQILRKVVLLGSAVGATGALATGLGGTLLVADTLVALVLTGVLIVAAPVLILVCHKKLF
jgi:hypothetical protein